MKKNKIIAIKPVGFTEKVIASFLNKYKISYTKSLGSRYEFYIYDKKTGFLISEALSINADSNDIEVMCFYPNLKSPKINKNGIGYALIKNSRFFREELSQKVKKVMERLQELEVITYSGNFNMEIAKRIEPNFEKMLEEEADISDYLRCLIFLHSHSDYQKYMSAATFYLIMAKIVKDYPAINDWRIELKPAMGAARFYQSLLPFNFNFGGSRFYYNLNYYGLPEPNFLIGQIKKPFSCFLREYPASIQPDEDHSLWLDSLYSF